MFGDRLDTDILFGKRGGVSTMLVLTGLNQLHDLVGLDDSAEPDYVAPSVGSLLCGRDVEPEVDGPTA